MRKTFVITLILLAALLVAPSGAALAQDAQGPNRVYFQETGHYLGGEFLKFWREYGGIRIFGYPLSPELVQDGVTVQYFERHVFEYYPDNPDEYVVLLRRLGVEDWNDRDLSNDEESALDTVAGSGQFFPATRPILRESLLDYWNSNGGVPVLGNLISQEFENDSEADSGQLFPATSQYMRESFLEHWESNGGVRVFGYPISREFEIDGTVYQYTERALLGDFPDNPEGWQVVAERLGAEAAERDGIDISPQEHDGETPQYHEDLWQVPEPEDAGSYALPSQIRIDKIGVSAPFEHVGRTAAGAMQAPVGWNNVAWYNRNAIPGEQGNAVVAGHLDAPGGVPATFWNLRQLVPGDHVTIISETGEELVFEVTGSEQFYMSNVPTSRIFGNTDARNMNLITCAGSWNTSIGMYDQRLVVYTTLVE